MTVLRLVLQLILLLVLGNAHAALDPVAWSLSPAAGFPTVLPGETSSVTYTLTVDPSFPGAVMLYTKFSESSRSFTITDGCNSRTLNPGDSCTVVIAFTPTDSTTSTIQMSYQYNDSVIPVPRLSVSGAAHNTGIVGTISGLPSSISLSPLQQPVFTITYTNTSSADVTGYAGNAAGTNLLSSSATTIATVAVSSNFCGTSSAPVTIKGGHSCTIQGQVTPVSAGSVNISGLFTYNNDQDTSTPSQATTVISSGSSCFSAAATLPFQNPTLRYADNILQFTYTNACATTQTMSDVTFSSSGSSSSPLILGPPSSIANAAYDRCSGQSVASHSSCTVLVPVIPQNNGTLTVTATAGGVSASSATTVNEPAYNHSITFVNQCPFPVWYGIGAPGDPTASPSPSAYQLHAQSSGAAPTTKTITVTATGTGYSGIIIPRTGCRLNGSSFSCATGDCASGTNGQCTNTGYEPFTRIEEVFPSASTQGNYDIVLQIGPTIPAEFKGLGPSSSQTSAATAPFTCSGVGAPIPIPFPPPYLDTLGACSWTYTVPNTPAGSSPIWYFVKNNSGALSSCSACSSPSVCGLAYDTTPEAGKIVLACGDLLGYWTLNQLGTSPASAYSSVPAQYNPYTVFNFTTTLNSVSGFQNTYPSGTSAYDLYSCTPRGAALKTCYPSTDTTFCCGAQNWNQSGSYGAYLTAQASNYSGGAPNPDWTGTNTGLPITPYDSIVWLKLACPTAYSYPFDDQSASFICNYKDAAQTQAVAMDFEVVFCPGGIVGALSTTP